MPGSPGNPTAPCGPSVPLSPGRPSFPGRPEIECVHVVWVNTSVVTINRNNQLISK